MRIFSVWHLTRPASDRVKGEMKKLKTCISAFWCTGAHTVCDVTVEEFKSMIFFIHEDVSVRPMPELTLKPDVMIEREKMA